MSKTQQNAPADEPGQAPVTQDVAVPAESERKIDVAEIRKECIKLAHSASKGVRECLIDAAIYAHWVETGEFITPADVNAG